jgi:hypothetical protein
MGYLLRLAGMAEKLPQPSEDGDKSPFTDSPLSTGNEVIVVFNDPRAASHFVSKCDQAEICEYGNRVKITRSEAMDLDKLMSDYRPEELYIECDDSLENLDMSNETWVDTYKAVLEDEDLYEKAPPGQEEFIKAAKPDFKKKYGKDWEKVLYASAWKRHNESIDFSNGYDSVQDHEEVGDYAVDYFPDGQTGTAPKKTGTAGARHGDNPLKSRQWEALDESAKKIHENLVYRYRDFKKKD